MRYRGQHTTMPEPILPEPPEPLWFEPYTTIGIDVPFGSFNAAYPQLVKWCQQNGLAINPRGLACKEARPGYFSLTDCTKGLYTGHDRRLNYRFLAIEALQYLAGHGNTPWHAELLVAVNSRMAAFRNPTTELFDGAYGPRLKSSIRYVIDKLQSDPDTRQAYMPIWSPLTQQELEGSLDLPCTLGFHFLRTGENPHGDHSTHSWLDMVANMRSNDLHWGTPYDVAAFCALQCAVARLTGLTPGRYFHTAGSLHLYEAHQPEFNESTDWLQHLQVPDPGEMIPDSLNYPRLIGGCRLLLAELYRHHKTQGHWPNFVSDLETRGGGDFLPDYWQQWGELVRHTWKGVS